MKRGTRSTPIERLIRGISARVAVIRALSIVGTSCQVAEHCWDPVEHAIVTYGYLFEGLIQARQREV
jgi:hypothetical protein